MTRAQTPHSPSPEEREAIFHAVVEQTLVGIWVIQDGVVRYANSGLAAMFGFARASDLIDRVAAVDLVAPSDRPALARLLQAPSPPDGPGVHLRFTGLRRSGHSLRVEIHCKPFIYGGHPAVVGVLTDITEQCRAEAELEHRASYDSLTGLPNRSLLFDRLNQTIAHARRNDELFAFLFLDLDGFKAVNDECGHEAGDTVLRVVAERFSGCLRASDTLARLGGDEFAVIAPGLLFGDDVKPIVAKLQETLASPITFGNQHFKLSVSIGIALFPSTGQDAHELYKAADSAMYAAKLARHGSYLFATTLLEGSSS